METLAQLAFRELRPVGLLYRMLFESRSGFVAVIAAGALLLAGCRGYVHNSKEQSPKHAKATTQAKVNEGDAIEAHAHYATALVLELNGDTAESLNEFYESAIRDLDNETLVMEVSRRLLQARQTEKARELLIQASARPKASATVFARLGFVYFQLGKVDQAVLADRTAIRRNPRSIVGYQNLFLVFTHQKKPQEALKLLDDAAKVSNPGFEFLVALGELYNNFAVQNPGQRDAVNARGLAVLMRATKENPGDPQLRLRL
ncbi:MAG TPA: tetratricopeptide repeat protein, partial [Candidatus Paceibacterota bacterium]|nr:tetratricopeptide repeat protein [Candidatus Paceibacterota bacterium]